MSKGINKVILVGNLGNEPEIRSTQTGSKVANISVAVFVKVVVRFIHAAFNKTSSSARISFGGFSHTSVIWLQSLISPDQRLGLRFFACL